MADRQAIADGPTLPSSDGYYAFQRLADIARSKSVVRESISAAAALTAAPLNRSDRAVP